MIDGIASSPPSASWRRGGILAMTRGMFRGRIFLKRGCWCTFNCTILGIFAAQQTVRGWRDFLPRNLRGMGLTFVRNDKGEGNGRCVITGFFYPEGAIDGAVFAGFLSSLRFVRNDKGAQ